MRAHRAGFTLIELLIVVVIIGVLAAIAIPSFRNTKDKALEASLSADIHRMASDEEGWYADHGTYADNATMGFATTTKNAVNMGLSGVGGWSAEIYSNADSRVWRCGLQIGGLGPVDPHILKEGVVYCYAP